MNKAKIICIIILFAGKGLGGLAQSADEIERLKQVHTPHQHIPDYSSYTEGDGILKRAIGAAFIGYKKYISSQDGMHCVFHPSCSSYAIQSVQHKGVFLGGLAAIDRLTRCHGFSAKHYPIHPETKRLYDPVE